MIARRTVVLLGLSQLICWGITYYLIGGFGASIVADLGWPPTLVYGGFSAALLVMGLVSPVTGRLIDRFGGRPVMAAGSLCSAIGCAGLALSHNVLIYYAAWLCLGLAMRLTLYDAAFAALARLGGPEARQPMAQITLLGGLSSTVFWPLGHRLALAFGWRGALLAYAGFALLTLPLHLAIPAGRYRASPGARHAPPPALAATGSQRLLAGGLYVVIVTLANFLNSGMSAHMIDILSGLGLGAGLAVWISTLRGIGQSSSRLCEVAFGKRLHPLQLNLLATAGLPLCFLAGVFSGHFLAAAIVFAFLYGASNGLVTITRGTLPLVLFDHRTYGSFVGQLLVPSFLLSAVSPLAYAFVIAHFGERAALDLSIVLASVIVLAAAILKWRFHPAATATPPSQGLSR